MVNTNPTQDEIHKHLLQQYKKRVSATKAAKNINEFYGNVVVPVRTAQRWFKMFKEGRQSVVRKLGQGRPQTVDRRPLGRKLRRNKDLTSVELASGICSQPTAWRYLKKRGKKWRKQREIPHDLTPQQKEKRAGTCYRNWNLVRHGRLNLKNIVTHDQTWVFYDGRVCRKQWLGPDEVGERVPKRDIHGKKQMLCLYWCMDGPLCYKLLKPGETFNSERYCTHLDKVQAEIRRKKTAGEWNGPVKLLDDNAKSHRSQRSIQHVKNTLLWDKIEHSPYSPDVAPSDYHVFLSLKNFMRGRQFKNHREVKAALHEYFESKEPDFWARGIRKLPKRWLMVHYNRGEYLIQ